MCRSIRGSPVCLVGGDARQGGGRPCCNLPGRGRHHGFRSTSRSAPPTARILLDLLDDVRAGLPKTTYALDDGSRLLVRDRDLAGGRARGRDRADAFPDGPDGRGAENRAWPLAVISPNLACRKALAISTDAPILRAPSGRRVYLFDPRGWRAADFDIDAREGRIHGTKAAAECVSWPWPAIVASATLGWEQCEGVRSRRSVAVVYRPVRRRDRRSQCALRRTARHRDDAGAPAAAVYRLAHPPWRTGGRGRRRGPLHSVLRRSLRRSMSMAPHPPGSRRGSPQRKLAPGAPDLPGGDRHRTSGTQLHLDAELLSRGL